MSNSLERKNLPILLSEVKSGLDYMVSVGGNSNLQAAWIDEIRFRVPELSKLEIGISMALNQLCYDLDELASLYYPGDSRESQCRTIIDEIQDFEISKLRGR